MVHLKVKLAENISEPTCPSQNYGALVVPWQSKIPGAATDPTAFGKQIEKEMNVSRQNILKNKTDSQEVYKKYYNKRTGAEPREFPVGSLVFAQSQPRAPKLEGKYYGPLIVLKIAQIAPEAPRAYLLQNVKTGLLHKGLINGNRLKLANIRRDIIEIPVKAAIKDSAQSSDAIRIADKAKLHVNCHQGSVTPAVLNTATSGYIARHNANYSNQRHQKQVLGNNSNCTIRPTSVTTNKMPGVTRR